MADIIVDVSLPNPITANVTSPTQALGSNVYIPGPQGPAGPKGNPTTINSLGAENIIITGADGNIVYTTGLNTIFISGNSGYFQSAVNSLTTNLNSTGSSLINSINSLSGLFTGHTGSLDNNYATDAQLQSTGSNLYTLLTNFSGNLDATYASDLQLYNTGSTLDNKINSLSGYSASIINLQSTGSNLYSMLIGFSGNLDATYATDIQLATTGSTLNTRINNLSGYINSSSSNILFTTGNQIKSGRLIIGDDAGSIVDPNSEYTLSLQTNSPRTWLEILNHSGTNKGVFFGIEGNDFEQYNWQAGDIKFFTSENFSNGIERLRIKNDGKVGIGTSSPSEKLEVVGNVIANNLVYNTGNQNISGIKTFDLAPIISGNPFITGNLSLYATTINLGTTGSTLDIKINNLSGYVNSQDVSISNNLTSTGATLINNLFNTGSNLNTKINDLSGYVNTQDNNISTNLYNTGNTLNNKINSLSGYTDSQDTTISSNLRTTGSTLDTKINNLSGYVNTQDTTISNNLTTTGITLDNKINSLSGSSVLLYGNQSIGGVKTFRDNVYINNLYVTGTETIVNTAQINLASNYLLLNVTGGAVDGGIFFVTGNGLTGINDTGPIIGFDHSTKFKFGFSTRNSDLSTLPDIASVQQIEAYSGVANNTFSTITNLYNTGSNLNNKINSLSGYVDSQNTTISNNLRTTGSTLDSKINSLSGWSASAINLASTGSTLDSKINSLSGWSASASNLASTGSNLNNRINNLSGYINSSASNIVFTTGNQTISGVKSFAQDTVFGDSAQGDFLVISGNNFTVYGSGNFTSGLFVNGNPVLTGSSTLYATTVNLASTGSTLQTNINNLSGYINSSGSNILFTTGNQTISGNKTFTSSSALIVRTISGFKDGSPNSLNLIAANDNNVAPGVNLAGNIILRAGTGVVSSSSTYGTITLNAGGPRYNGSINLNGNVNFNSDTTASTLGTRTINFYKTGINFGAPSSIAVVTIDNSKFSINDADGGSADGAIGFYISGVGVTPALYVNTTTNQIINGLKTFTSGIDIYSGTSPQSLRIFNSTGTNSGEFAVIDWEPNLGIVSPTTNALVIGTQASNNGILRDLIITGENIALYPRSGRLYINGTASLNDNLLQTSQCSGNITGYITGFGFTGNYTGSYEGGYFLGRTKLTQNTIQLVDSSFGSNYVTKSTNASTQNFRSVAVSSDGRYQIVAVNDFTSTAVGYIYVSNDYGNTWTPRITDTTRPWLGVAISADGKYQVACHYGGYIYISNNYGNTWNAKDSIRNWLSIAISSDGKYQTAVSNTGVHISNNYGDTWTITLSSSNLISNAMSSDGKYQYLTLDAGVGGNIYRSSDYGNTWVIIQSGPSTYYASIATSADGKYVIHNRSSSNFLYISNNYGNTFIAKSTAAYYNSVAVSDNGKYMVAGGGRAYVSTGGIYFSSDYGNTWKEIIPNSNLWTVAISSNAKYVIGVCATLNPQPIHIFKTDELIDGNLTINNNLTLPSGDFYSYNATGVNSGEFGLIGWRNNQFVIGSQRTTSGILRDIVITGNNININASGVLNIFDNTNIVGNLTTSGSGIFTSGIDLNNSKLINATPDLLNVSANFNITGTQNSRLILANSPTIITGSIVSGNPIGFNTSIIQISSGQVLITGIGSNVIVNSYNNQFRTAAQYATISILHTGNDGYIMYGNTST
jgi:hypothetical protein